MQPQIDYHLSNRLVLPGEVCAGGLDELISRPREGIPMVRLGSGKEEDLVDQQPEDYRWQDHVRDFKSEDGKVTYFTLDLPKSTYEDFYNGLANGFLWPFFHQRLDIARRPYTTFANGQPDFDQERFTREAQATVFVNDQFARLIAERIQPKPSDTLVVHDYHFFEAGRRLRAHNVTCPTAFFLHIPAASPDLYAQLPEEQQQHVRKSLQGLYSYDLVGVQAPWDLKNIWDLVGDRSAPRNPVLFHPYEMERQDLNGHWRTSSTSLSIMPVVGHYDLYKDQAADPKNEAAARELLNRIGLAQPNIMTWGRLDYSKNGVNQAKAVRMAIEQFHVAANQVCFLHHAAYGRKDVLAYQQEYEKITAAHTVLAEKHAASGLQAKLVTDKIERPILLAIARKARVGLITPLADGFNLTAAEYLAAQDLNDPGVLILGRNSGAANVITASGALLVDATNPEEIAKNIALAMNEKEMPRRRRRTMHRRAMDQLTEYSNQDWQSFLMDGAHVGYKNSYARAHGLPRPVKVRNTGNFPFADTLKR